MSKKMDIFVWLVSLVYVGSVFLLPDTIPIHWNIYNEVDGYGSRYIALIFALLPLVTYYGMTLDKVLDPKKKDRENKEIFDFFRNLLTIFFMMIGGYFLFAMFRPTLLKEVSPAFVIAFLLIGIGNYLPRVPQNYTLGVKTPWTLENEYVWNKTHRMSGYLFVGCGLLTLVCSFMSGSIPFIVMLASIIVTAVATLVYSYILYKKEEKKDDNN